MVGLRWLATAAKAGPSALALWVLAGLLFFVPQGLVVTELASRFPQEGGIYQWTKRALGEKHGYVCGWCYWINNVLYYPNLLISTAVIATFVIGKGESGLASNWTYVLSATLVCLWLAVLMNIVGVGTGKWLQNAGGVGTYIPGVVLIALGAIAVFGGHPSANPFTRQNIVPDLGHLSGLNLWASIAFAFAGLELSSAMGGEVRDPRRTLPRAILISGAADRARLHPWNGRVALAGARRATSTSSRDSCRPLPLEHASSDRRSGGSRRFAPRRTRWATSAAWVRGSADRRASRSRSASIATSRRRSAECIRSGRRRTSRSWCRPCSRRCFLLVSLLGKGTTVEKAYLIILDTQLLIYFIPYVYLFLSFMIHRRTPAPPDAVRVPGGRWARR